MQEHEGLSSSERGPTRNQARKRTNTPQPGVQGRQFRGLPELNHAETCLRPLSNVPDQLASRPLDAGAVALVCTTQGPRRASEVVASRSSFQWPLNLLSLCCLSRSERHNEQDSIHQLQEHHVNMEKRVSQLEQVVAQGSQHIISMQQQMDSLEFQHEAERQDEQTRLDVLGDQQETQQKKLDILGKRQNIHKRVMLVIMCIVGCLQFSCFDYLMFTSFMPQSLAPQKPRLARLYVERHREGPESESSYNLPGGESPASLQSYLSKVTKVTYQIENDARVSKQVYVSTAASNRLAETLLDMSQVRSAGQIDAFLFIWVSVQEHCRDTELPRDHSNYIREQLNSTAIVGFVCWWDGGFLEATFSKRSLKGVEDFLFGT